MEVPIPSIFGLCFRPKFQGISPEKKKKTEIWYVYVPPLNRILKVPLIWHWVYHITVPLCRFLEIRGYSAISHGDQLRLVGCIPIHVR